jgi:hypothetical protein
MSIADAMLQIPVGTTAELVGLTILSIASSQRIYKTTTTRGRNDR